MRKQIIVIAALLCVALSGYAQMVVKGKAEGLLYEVNLSQQKATVLGVDGSPTELTIPIVMPQIQVTEFALNPGAVGAMMNIPAQVTAIADAAFAACSELAMVTMESATPPTLNGTFASTFPSGVVIYVPSNSAVNAYHEAGWLNVQADATPPTGPNGNCGAEGDNLKWVFADSTLYITGSGAMADFNFDDATWSANTPWKQYRFQIKKLDLPEGMTYIGRYAFWGLDGLKEVVLPEGLIETSDYSFSNCQRLRSFTFPTTLQTVGDGMFGNNYALREITANGLVPPDMKQNTPNLNAEIIDVYVQEGYVETYEAAWGTTYYSFHNPKDMCGPNLRWKYNTSTHALTFYLFDETKPASMYDFVNASYEPDFFTYPDAGWYEYHDEISAISLPEGLTHIGDLAFCNCSTLVAEHRNIVIPSTVTSIGKMAFRACTNLKSVSLPEGLDSIGDEAFRSCVALDSITIPSTVTDIGVAAFRYCESLSSINFPEGLRIIKGSICEGCDSLKEVTLPASVIFIGQTAFINDQHLNKVTMLGANPPVLAIVQEPTFGLDVFPFSGAIDVYIPEGSLQAYTTNWGTVLGGGAGASFGLGCTFIYHDPAEVETPTDVENVQSDKVQCNKVLKNGQIIILRGENTYSLDGRKL